VKNRDAVEAAKRRVAGVTICECEREWQNGRSESAARERLSVSRRARNLLTLSQMLRLTENSRSRLPGRPVQARVHSRAGEPLLGCSLSRRSLVVLPYRVREAA